MAYEQIDETREIWKGTMWDTMDMEIDLRDLLIMLWNRIWTIALCAIGGGLLSFFITYFFITPLYTASVSMYVSNNDNRSNSTITTNDLSASQSLVSTYIVVLKSDTLLTKVADKLDGDYSVEDLRKMLTAESIDGTEAFKVSVTNKDPKMAQKISNYIADVAPDEIVRVVKAGNVEVIDYAKLPDKAVWPLARNTAIGFLLGIFLSAAAIVLFNLMDITIRTAEDLSKYYELPVLGEIPTISAAEDL